MQSTSSARLVTVFWQISLRYLSFPTSVRKMDDTDSSQHHRQAVQGMLHMIDTNLMSASDSRQQLAIIQAHIREHAYYKRTRQGQVVTRTGPDCKLLLSQVACESHLSRLKGAKETMLDVLFRIGSSGLPEAVLNKYNYNPTTFDPTTLPGPLPDTNHLGVRPSTKDDHTTPHHVPPDQNDDASDDVRGEDEIFAEATSSATENDALLPMPAPTTQQHALWTLLQDIDATSHLADHAEWKYRDHITRIASYKLLIKQFSLVHRRYSVIYPYTAEALHGSLKAQYKARKLPELRQTPFSRIYKLGSKAFEPTYVAKLKRSHEMVIDATKRPRYSSLPRYSTSVQVLAELNGDPEELIPLRGDGEDKRVSQSDIDIDHTSRSSSLTSASWHDAESTSSDSQSSELNVTLRKSTITEKLNTPPSHPTSSPLTNLAAFSAEPTRPNLALWESDFSDLSEHITQAVSSLFTNLNLPLGQVSPYIPPSALSLRSVLAARLGGDFQSACTTFRESDSFSAFHVTQCLIAALIHEHLLKEKLDWQRALCIQLGWSKIEDVQNLFTMLRDPSQNAVAREKHLPRRFAQAILKSTDNDHDGAVLPQFMQRVAGQLTGDLAPYIETLVQIAALLNQEKIHAYETWLEQFGEDIAAIVTSAAELKLKLTSSEIDHGFFWPIAGEKFNGDIHKAIGASGNSVAFTVMPGMRLVEGESTAVLPAHVVCCSGEEEET
ncbi:hypothetical protein HII31_02831 [Pseudocercospora fuligena]|uniref:Uncharacterized protein n=1 Tax=Pseudocercospora fuligena TaxID=685502 RepID=A0A8H6RRD6_9PEZI|nr:hypothetical protein HII31_02831 [Pseudocercospora fuligena]